MSLLHRSACVILAIAALPLAEPSAVRAEPHSGAAPGELAPLQGAWTLLAYAVDGKTLRQADEQCVLTVEGDRWRIVWRTDAGGQQVEQGVVRIVDAEGSPPVLDLVHDAGPYRGTTTRAFYQVAGDTLRYTSVVVPATLADARVVASTTTWQRKPR